MTTAKENIEIVHRFFRTEQADFKQMVGELLKKYSPAYMPVRLVFFGAPADNEEYIEHFICLREAVEKKFKANKPLVSYVAQPVDTEGMAMEVHEVALTAEDAITCRHHGGIACVIVEREGCKRLFLGGVTGDILHQNIREQADAVLASIRRVLKEEQMPVSAIVRQWNYIEKITDYDSAGHQHYQDFNDARSLFYQDVEWHSGYPAATGIGTQWGGVMIDMDVLLCGDHTVQVSSVDNPLQIAAHAYSRQVLLGETDGHKKTTPKFERAKAVWKEDHGFIYISGTAAIRGEQSLKDVGIEQQTLATLENIEYLVSRENLNRTGVPVTKDAQLINFRVYVKRANDLEKARTVVEKRYPGLPALYTLTDVCRKELLIEIEGMGSLE